MTLQNVSLVAIAVALLAATILIGAIIVAVRAPTNPEQPTNSIVHTPTAPVVLPDPPRADDVVLGKVVSILDGLTGLKTKRTQIVEDGPRRVRWRLA